MAQTIRHGTEPTAAISDAHAPRVEVESLGALAGEGRAVTRVREWLRGLASLQAPVLLVGEAGSGRSTAAGLLHAWGTAAQAPFVRIAAGGVGPEATPLRGTIHLEDLEQLPAAGQGRWRRFVDASHEGSRLIASAGPLFADRVASGGFDAALASALQRFEVRLPTLRDRPEDLPVLASALLASVGRELGRPDRRLTDGAVRRLARERWPGNLTELRRVIERLIAFCDGPSIGLTEVEAVLEDIRPSVAELRERHQVAERVCLIRHLEETGGNVTETAERMQRSRAAIYRLVEKHGIALRRGA